jgi:hypothetical protein
MRNWIATLERKYEELTSMAADAAAPVFTTGPEMRPLPNEDVFLFRKKFPNEAIDRMADPADGRVCWRAFVATLGGAAMLIAFFAPSAYYWALGHQLEQGRAEQARLVKQLSELQHTKALRQSVPGQAEYARRKGYVEPAYAQVVHLPPVEEGALAKNLKSMENPAE